MERQRLALIILDRGGAITKVVARADMLFKSSPTLLLYNPKKRPGFLWQGADDANIKLMHFTSHLFYLFQIKWLFKRVFAAIHAVPHQPFHRLVLRSVKL